jgi:hypothetical protein
LKINGREIARIDHAKDRRQAFRELKKIADGYLAGQQPKTHAESGARSPS